jgi:hypothetical protein
MSPERAELLDPLGFLRRQHGDELADRGTLLVFKDPEYEGMEPVGNGIASLLDTRLPVRAVLTFGGGDLIIKSVSLVHDWAKVRGKGKKA